MFSQVYGEDGLCSYLANHCAHCKVVQEEMYWHSEPGNPFFDIPHGAAGDGQTDAARAAGSVEWGSEL